MWCQRSLIELTSLGAIYVKIISLIVIGVIKESTICFLYNNTMKLLMIY